MNGNGGRVLYSYVYTLHYVTYYCTYIGTTDTVLCVWRRENKQSQAALLTALSTKVDSENAQNNRTFFIKTFNVHSYNVKLQ